MGASDDNINFLSACSTNGEFPQCVFERRKTRRNPVETAATGIPLPSNALRAVSNKR